MVNRLKLPDIVPKKKKIFRVKSFRNALGLANTSPQFHAFEVILRSIENGTPLPERYYRSQRNSTSDDLLELFGIMHLHLGDPSTEELLFLIQYDLYVVLLEINNHQHFETQPIGIILENMHKQNILTLNECIEEDKQKKVELIRRSLLR